MSDSTATLRAIRGATTIDVDDAAQVQERVAEMLGAIVERNDLSNEDLISCFFTATGDITTMFPATAARAFGWTDVPLLGAVELAVDGGTPLCIRVLVHVSSSLPRSEIQHVYLRGATDLRDAVPGR